MKKLSFYFDDKNCTVLLILLLSGTPWFIKWENLSYKLPFILPKKKMKKNKITPQFIFVPEMIWGIYKIFKIVHSFLLESGEFARFLKSLISFYCNKVCVSQEKKTISILSFKLSLMSLLTRLPIFFFFFLKASYYNHY